MKLLLADDEVITRRGLVENIDWKSLQIHEIIEAGDGIEALELAKVHSPEIILTDIRMPRMDGVSLAFKAREILPDVSIIFMSGYSDKEYLRAAIQLKAVSYVEKPINNSEIIRAVQEARSYHSFMKGGRYSQHIQKSTRLALALTKPESSDFPPISEMSEALGISFDRLTPFATLLLKKEDLTLQPDDSGTSATVYSLHDEAKKLGLDFIVAFKYDSILIVHVYGAPALEAAALNEFAVMLAGRLDNGTPWFIAEGPIVKGAEHVYESYSRAVILLQSSFFYDPCSIIVEHIPQQTVSAEYLRDCSRRFADALSHKDINTAIDISDSLNDALKECQTLLPSVVRDIYFRFFISLEQSYHTQHLSEDYGDRPIWDRITSCGTLSELHAMLREALSLLEDRAVEASGESVSVRLMKECMHRKYADSSLSVRDISEYSGLSVTYACTLFKNETGTTLNQYLTAYRMEQAMQLLADPSIKVSDISSNVGYLDGNYFGKSFKKATGLTPSEYREKLLS